MVNKKKLPITAVSLIKMLIVTFIITVFSIEFFSFVFTKLEFLIVNNEPSYMQKQGTNWRVENKPWGAWHKKNFKDQHSTKCFDVSYESNNLGARDNLKYDKSLKKNSVVLIGDSFAEGWGVELKKIFPKVLEKKIFKKVLNFGTSGSFGPVQEYIIYNDLVSKLPHDELIYFFLPANDFTDNDIRYWSDKVHGARHRPYFKKTSKEKYIYFYPNENSNSKLLVNTKSFLFFNVKSFLIRYTYTANTLRSVNALLSKNNNRKSSLISNVNSGTSYFFDDIESIEGAIYFSKKILSSSINLKRRIVVIIPTLEDLNLISSGKKYKDLYWFKSIQKIASETNTEIIDLADYFKKENYKKMIHTCDDHWNDYGHKMVADLISREFYN